MQIQKNVINKEEGKMRIYATKSLRFNFYYYYNFFPIKEI